MIKSILAFLTLVFFKSSAYSTHIIGGTINYSFVSSNSTSSIYSVSVEFYYDCLNGSSSALKGDTSINIGIYDMDSKILARSKVFKKRQLFRYNGCNTISLCLDIGRFIDTIQIKHNTNGYNLIYERCCRPDYIVNLYGNSNGINLFAHLNPKFGSNNSPIPYYLPKFINEANVTNTDFGMVDLDRDSLVYTIETPYSGGTSVDPTPALAAKYSDPKLIAYSPKHSLNRPLGDSGNINLNSANGKLQFKSKNLGSFVLCVEIKEYRKGKLIGITRRDMTYTFLILDTNLQNTATLKLNKPLHIQGNTVKLAWNMCPLGVKEYALERKTTISNWETIHTNTINEPFDDTISFNRKYYYRVKSSLGSKSTISNLDSIYISSTSLPNINKTIISIHPNPFQNEIYIECKNWHEAKTIKLYNAFGVVVSSNEVIKSEEIINTSSLSNGVYYIEIRDNLGNYSKQKLIKLSK